MKITALEATDPVVAFELRNAATRVASLEVQLVTELAKAVAIERADATDMEREACALLAERYPDSTMTPNRIAAAIRARGSRE